MTIEITWDTRKKKRFPGRSDTPPWETAECMPTAILKKIPGHQRRHLQGRQQGSIDKLEQRSLSRQRNKIKVGQNGEKGRGAAGKYAGLSGRDPVPTHNAQRLSRPEGGFICQ